VVTPLNRLHAGERALGASFVIMKTCLVCVCVQVPGDAAAKHRQTGLVLFRVTALAANTDIAPLWLDDLAVGALEVVGVVGLVLEAAIAVGALNHVVEAATEWLAAAPVEGNNLRHGERMGVE
jgi:hypothetical protein